MGGINVLSLFDGISCGMVALERAGIEVNNYFASEIDKYATVVSKKNHPNIIHLGDVNNWKKWKLPKIDLLIGGSPCQGFSKAGAGLNFDDPRSKLFFVYVDILKHLKRKNGALKFLLENVKMKKEWTEIISNKLKVKPVLINSALVSAQNRERLYWTNIGEIEQPSDRFIFLKDVLENNDSPLVYKSYCIDANYSKGGSIKNHGTKEFQKLRESERRMCVEIRGAALRNQVTKRGTEAQLNIRKDEKSNCVVGSYAHKLNGVVRMGNTTNNIHYRKLTPVECERLQTLTDNYTAGISDTQRYKCIGNGWTIDVITYIFQHLYGISIGIPIENKVDVISPNE